MYEDIERVIPYVKGDENLIVMRDCNAVVGGSSVRNGSLRIWAWDEECESRKTN